MDEQLKNKCSELLTSITNNAEEYILPPNSVGGSNIILAGGIGQRGLETANTLIADPKRVAGRLHLKVGGGGGGGGAGIRSTRHVYQGVGMGDSGLLDGGFGGVVPITVATSGTSELQEFLEQVPVGGMSGGEVGKGKFGGVPKTQVRKAAKLGTIMMSQRQYRDGTVLTIDELDKGLLSLAERKLVPRNADFTPAFFMGTPPLISTSAQLHNNPNHTLLHGIRSLQEASKVAYTAQKCTEGPNGGHSLKLDPEVAINSLSVHSGFAQGTRLKPKKKVPPHIERLMVADREKRGNCLQSAGMALLSSRAPNQQQSFRETERLLADQLDDAAVGGEEQTVLAIADNEANTEDEAAKNSPRSVFATTNINSIIEGNTNETTNENSKGINRTFFTSLPDLEDEEDEEPIEQQQQPSVQQQQQEDAQGLVQTQAVIDKNLQHFKGDDQKQSPSRPADPNKSVPQQQDEPYNFQYMPSIPGVARELTFQFDIVTGGFEYASLELSTFRRALSVKRLWGAAVDLLKRLENVFKRMKIIKAIVSAFRFCQIVLYAHTTAVTNDILLSCVNHQLRSAVTKSLVETVGTVKGLSVSDDNVDSLALVSASQYASYLGYSRHTAATKLGAWWRMTIARKLFQKYQKRTRAVYAVQEQWKAHMRHQATKKVIARIRERRRNMFALLMQNMKKEWTIQRYSPRLEIHVLSSSDLDQRRRDVTYCWAEEQCDQIFRAYRVAGMTPVNGGFGEIDIVIVTSTPLNPDLQEYMNKILSHRGVENVEARVQYVHCSLFDHPQTNMLKTSISTISALLSSTRTLKLLKQIAGGRVAYVIPLRPSILDAELCALLGIPLMGPNPLEKENFDSISAQKRAIEATGLPAPPFVPHIRDRNELFEALAQMLLDHGDLYRSWVIKLEDDINGRGTCVVEFGPMLPAAEQAVMTVMASASQTGGQGLNNVGGMKAVFGEDRRPLLSMIPNLLSELRNKYLTGQWSRENAISALRTHAANASSQTARFPRGQNSFGGGSWLGFLEEIERVGCCIEAAPAGRILSASRLHMFVEPDRSILYLGSNESLGHDYLSPTVSIYPASLTHIQPFIKGSRAICNSLSTLGVLGHVTVDFVLFEESVVAPIQIRDSGIDGTIANNESLELIGSSESEIDQEDGEPIVPDGADASSSIELQNEDSQVATSKLNQDVNAATAKQLKTIAVRRQVGLDGIEYEIHTIAWIIGVELGLGEDSSAIAALNVLAQVEPTIEGSLVVTESAIHMQQQALTQAGRVTANLPATRCAVVAHSVHVPCAKKMSVNEIFQKSKRSGCSFDLLNNVGVAFLNIHRGASSASVLAVHVNFENALKKMSSFLTFLLSPVTEKSTKAGMKASMVTKPFDLQEGETPPFRTIAYVQDAVRTALKKRAMDAKIDAFKLARNSRLAAQENDAEQLPRQPDTAPEDVEEPLGFISA